MADRDSPSGHDNGSDGGGDQSPQSSPSGHDNGGDGGGDQSPQSSPSGHDNGGDGGGDQNPQSSPSGHDNGGDGGGDQNPQSSVHENIANIGRIMKKPLPSNGNIAKDAKDTVQECVSEFISFVISEASDKCQKEKRKTINGDDLLWAMATLGFEDYMSPLKAYLARYTELEGDTKGSVRAADGPAMNESIGTQQRSDQHYVRRGPGVRINEPST